MPDAVTERLDILKQLVAQNPDDAFSRYGLATEYAREGHLEQAAAEYRTLLAARPDYAAAYYPAAQALEKLDKIDEARDLYRRGIEAMTRQGNSHGRDQLQTALDLLGPAG